VPLGDHRILTDGSSYGPMNLRRPLNLAVLSLAVLLATAVGCGAYVLFWMAPIGTAYAAKTLCSGVFVMGRRADDVIREDIVADNHPLLRLLEPSVDASQRMATASFLGVARRDANYHPGLGCTLSFGMSAAALRAASQVEIYAGRAEDWPASALRVGVDGSKLQAAVDWAFAEPDAARLRRTRALVVLRDGYIVAERYAPGFSAATPMPGWSMTKTTAAVLIGTLVKTGTLSVERKALLPEWRGPGDPRAQITLDQLLRMISGLHFTERYGDPAADVALMLFARADGAGYAIDKSLDAAPGTRWQYSSGTSNILSRVIRQAVGGSTEQAYLDFPRHALFGPVGMRSAIIEPDASGSFVTSSYMYATARDWARLGQLLLQDGVWEGARILPEGWVRYMATLTPQSTRRDFGAHLWLKVTPPFNSLVVPPPELPADAFHAIGYEGQFVSVIPSHRLVVVRLGLSRGDHVWDHEAFLARLLKAFPG
jgi:CubicO group peptidase (beta-lactamase class C family)